MSNTDRQLMMMSNFIAHDSINFNAHQAIGGVGGRAR